MKTHPKIVHNVNGDALGQDAKSVRNGALQYPIFYDEVFMEGGNDDTNNWSAAGKFTLHGGKTTECAAPAQTSVQGPTRTLKLTLEHQQMDVQEWH